MIEEKAKFHSIINLTFQPLNIFFKEMDESKRYIKCI